MQSEAEQVRTVLRDLVFALMANPRQIRAEMDAAIQELDLHICPDCGDVRGELNEDGCTICQPKGKTR